MSKDISARLQLSVRPKHYDLIYDRIDLEKHTFSGTCKLHCTAVTSSTVIQLHALEIQLVTATLIQNDSTESSPPPKQLAATSFAYHRRNQTVDIAFPEELVVGQDYVLVMDFIGVLNDQMCGLYRSTYTDIYGETRTMATTQFEATDARRAFPCADEPALKATFTLTVTIPAELQCISNQPMAETHTTTTTLSSGNDKEKKAVKTITFQTTPKMSTYLLALVVGEFDGISRTSNGIVTTVYTVPGKAAQAHFCLDTASRCLDLYQELFHVKYPLTKSDLLAIPDFAAGAMENWGCVTYREAKVLTSESTSETMKRGIARTVCHELAHQWFGNLVTMEYWTQLYLKEGMARFFEFVGIDALFPEWDSWTEFVQSVYGLAMSLDAMESSHPVEVEVHHPDEINEIFDSISYAKGASLIRMIATFCGMETFLEGMRVYLTRHAYSNTVTNDLWKCLEEVSGKPVVDFMAPWTLEMGYPILLLDNDGSLRAERYLASGPQPGAPTTPWPIPVTAKVEGSDDTHGPWVINGPDGDESEQLKKSIQEWSSSKKWFKLNIDQTAFFRVCYSKDQFSRLANVMKPDNSGNGLSTSDRLGLISDSFAAGKAGYTSIVDSLLLIEHFGEHETADYAVWQELSDNLIALVSLFRSEPFFGKFQSLIIKLYSRQMKVLGWTAQDGESGRTGTLRATVIGMMGIARDPDVLQQAFDLFMAFKNDKSGSPIPGDLQRTVFRCALHYDEPTVYASLKEIYEASTFPEEQRNCLSVMGSVKDSDLQAEMFDYIFNSGRVRSQDIAFPLGSLATSTDTGGRAAWKYFEENYSFLHSRFGSGPVWGACVALCSRGLTTCEEADTVESFFSDPSRSPGSAKRRLTQSLELVKTKAMRRERDRQAMEEYFRD